MSAHTIYLILVGIFFVTAPFTFISALLSPMPYGRYTKPQAGYLISKRYGWMIIEFPAFFIILLFFIANPPNEIAPYILLILWEIHYAYRTFLFPFKHPRNNTMLASLLIPSGIIFNFINASSNGMALTTIHHYTHDWLFDPRFIIGICIFVVGFAINYYSDILLMNLRKREEGYKIPQGGFFRWLSCPNYFGEVIAWFGWAMASWTLAGLAFAIFTFAHLVPRAIAYHAWYKQKFPNYPKNRYAIFFGII